VKVFKYSFYLLISCLSGLLGPTAKSRNLKPTKAATLKVMTFNIHHGENNVGKTNLNRVVELLKQHQT
jgi:hypothetical protein